MTEPEKSGGVGNSFQMFASKAHTLSVSSF